MEGKINVFGDADVMFAVYKDGSYADTIPGKSDGYRFDKAVCTNGATATWNREKWGVLVTTLSKTKTKCSLYFVTGSVAGEQSGENKIDDLLDQNRDQAKPTLVRDDNNNIRYIGKSPNNWVTFNSENWRIIGLMDGIQTSTGKTERLLKIIRSDSLGEYSWDSSASGVNNGKGVNEWSEADLQKELNNETNGYLNTVKQTGNNCFTYSDDRKGECPDWSTEGITATAKNMIETVVWNTGTAYTTDWTSSNATPLQYMLERSNNNGKQCTNGIYCNDSVPRKTTWTGKVGLMYPSDYGYATDGGGSQTQRDTCIYTPLYNWNNYSNCKNNDWLFDSSSYQWTMTPAPHSSGSYLVFLVNTGGRVGNDCAYYAYAVRPVVYLKSSVKIIGGDGSSGNPYTLSIN